MPCLHLNRHAAPRGAWRMIPPVRPLLFAPRVHVWPVWTGPNPSVPPPPRWYSRSVRALAGDSTTTCTASAARRGPRRPAHGTRPSGLSLAAYRTGLINAPGAPFEMPIRENCMTRRHGHRRGGTRRRSTAAMVAVRVPAGRMHAIRGIAGAGARAAPLSDRRSRSGPQSHTCPNFVGIADAML